MSNTPTQAPALPAHVQAMPLEERALRKTWLKRKFGSFEYHEEMLRQHHGFVGVLARALTRAEQDASPNAHDSGYKTIADEAKHFRARWFPLIQANDDLGKYKPETWDHYKHAATFRSIPDYSRYLMSEGDLLAWLNDAEQTELTKYWAPMAKMAENIRYTVDENWDAHPEDPYWILDEEYTGPIDWPANWRDEVAAAPAPDRLRCEANHPCPREGYWHTPAQPGSRRHFKAGEVMPDLHTDYGATIWEWDGVQG